MPVKEEFVIDQKESGGYLSNAFTVDLEDWYQGIELPRDTWTQYEERLEQSTNTLLNLFDDYGVKATFFVLGYNARRYPDLIKRIADKGHRIGSHGDNHEYVYHQSPDQFTSDLISSIESIKNACGADVLSYRAPFFSITRESFWALSLMHKSGIQYDSSIVPIDYYRYGIPDFRDEIHSPLNDGLAHDDLLEFPINTVRILGKRMPISGGTYFRVLPYRVVRDGIRKLNQRGKPVVFYLHPWEIDPAQPHLSLPLRVGAPHYANLNSTLPKLKRLLNDFRFAPMEDVVKNAKD